LGDAILSTSILNHLYEKYKGLRVTVACGELPSPLFKFMPFVEQLHVVHKRKYALHWVDLWQKLREDRFDWIIDLRGTPIGHFLRAKKRFIWKSKKYSKGHQVERFQKLMGLKERIFPSLWLKPERSDVLTQPTLVVAPAANWIGKQWPSSFFIKALQTFQETYPDAYVMLLASPHEKEVTDQILSALDKERTCSPLTNDLNKVGVAISQAKLFLGNDSGLMHMAVSLGVPCIGLFGPSDDTRYGPYGDQHHILRTPLSLKEIEALEGFSYAAPSCYMESLTPETVIPVLLKKWSTL